ncbi:hypothetical protein TUN199_05013 [Pyrenophora tritici-repentis]|uniref:Uncharacterized protein n=1 Tax=Pyrenophora tritici-repentis (strain Pt-1C-BFP) TaxID=426418 RepID=B2W1D9_PYRTR|nr:uncharacterized protein PTRG_04274 [Pyrenophora tritici-repentis Pt-1C-BFP]EDU47112.1 predicted protein [Pyrenophora tritici-repentis Pt-1C-BFP]KAI0578692.1 hypothetical protein Alg215_06208 [Pyrenophora tritici-repentis]KAI0623009.1 hypothetical protein TUN199_05013 [Pyrenophora tritici-repentis]PZC95123.1 hypothetical protein A1F95_06171 [Pyrenophora tritici-repentis]
MHLSSLLITAIAGFAFAAESSNLTTVNKLNSPVVPGSSVMASMASSMKSEASKITSTAPKTVTGTETATTTKDSKATNVAVAMGVGDAGMMAAALGVAAWML